MRDAGRCAPAGRSQATPAEGRPQPADLLGGPADASSPSWQGRPMAVGHGATSREEPRQEVRAAGGIFSAPRPVSTTPLTTGQPQLDLAEDGIRRDATYSPRTEMERSVPSYEENSAKRHVARTPSHRARTPAPLGQGWHSGGSGGGCAGHQAPRARAACSCTAGLHGQHERRGHSGRCWSKRALSPGASRARYLAACAPHAPQLRLPAPPTGLARAL